MYVCGISILKYHERHQQLFVPLPEIRSNVLSKNILFEYLNEEFTNYEIVIIRPTFPGINPDQEMRQCINKSYRTALITSENPELREVDLEPSSKRGCSNK